MKKILVVSGNIDHLAALSSMLSRSGYCVVAKRDAASALGVLTDRAGIDLVISDYALSDMDAANFISSVRRSRPASPPVILQSDRIDVQDYLAAVSLGAFDLLFRPFDTGELLRTVKVAMYGDGQKATRAGGGFSRRAPEVYERPQA